MSGKLKKRERVELENLVATMIGDGGVVHQLRSIANEVARFRESQGNFHEELEDLVLRMPPGSRTDYTSELRRIARATEEGTEALQSIKKSLKAIAHKKKKKADDDSD